MKDNNITVPFSIMALTVPAAEAATGKNWLPTLLLVLASFLLCTWMSVQEEPEWKWIYPLRSVVLVCLLSWALDQTHSCWPGEKAKWAVPAGLLLLAVYAIWKKSAVQASSVLRYGMYAILGVMAILGVPHLKGENFRPSAQLPDMWLAVVLMLPLMAQKTGKWFYNPVGIAALLAAILVGQNESLFQYSYGLSIRGMTEHMESLAACAITVGYYGLLCYLLDGIDRKGGNWQVWIAGGAAFVLYGSGMRIRPEAYLFLILMLWVVIPEAWAINQKLKKYEKSS